MWQNVLDFLTRYQRGVIIAGTLLMIFVGYQLVTRLMRRHFLAKAMQPENAANFLLLWRYAWFGIGFVFLLVSISGNLVSLGLSAAFLGMILGWSLQAPVTGIAAWLMIIVKRPFKIGDRIIISGIVGDVVDINLTHVVLNQVGGTVSGEEKSGRGVLIPNATLFQQIIHNYTAMESGYILDEVVVMFTFDSDVDEAERVLLAAAREVTADIIAACGKDPFIRLEITDWGVRFRLRFQTDATDRQRVTSAITSQLLKAVDGNGKLRFCYPHNEVILHRAEGPATPDAGA